MSRFRITPTQLFLSVAVATVACTAGTDKSSDTATAMADTGAAMADTSTATAMPTPSSVPGASTTGDTAVIKPININTATDAEILAIPGMGPRMLREFKEYRPYTSIEQFRREIGKYVDKNEVARLEKYIVIK